MAELQRLLLDGEDFAVREAAAVPVARLQGVEALPDLLRAYRLNLAEGHDNDGLTATLTDLARSDADGAAAILIGCFESTDEGTRADAAWLWGYLAAAVEPTPLFKAAKDTSPEVRAAAIDSLAAYEGREDVFAAIRHALADGVPSVRVAALAALRYSSDARAFSAVETLVRDQDASVRRWTEIARDAIRKRTFCSCRRVIG